MDVIKEAASIVFYSFSTLFLTCPRFSLSCKNKTRSHSLCLFCIHIARNRNISPSYPYKNLGV